MAPIVLELKKHPDTIIPVVAVTAQHREMLDQVLNLFQIKPDYDLDIMAQGQTLFDITTKAMLGLDKVLNTARKLTIHFLRERRIFVVRSKTSFNMTNISLMVISCQRTSKSCRRIAMNQHNIGFFRI